MPPCAGSYLHLPDAAETFAFAVLDGSGILITTLVAKSCDHVSRGNMFQYCGMTSSERSRLLAAESYLESEHGFHLDVHLKACTPKLFHDRQHTKRRIHIFSDAVRHQLKLSVGRLREGDGEREMEKKVVQ